MLVKIFCSSFSLSCNSFSLSSLSFNIPFLSSFPYNSFFNELYNFISSIFSSSNNSMLFKIPFQSILSFIKSSLNTLINSLDMGICFSVYTLPSTQTEVLNPLYNSDISFPLNELNNLDNVLFPEPFQPYIKLYFLNSLILLEVKFLYIPKFSIFPILVIMLFLSPI